MKCIKCGTDNKLKDRTTWGGRCSCKKCNHQFAFEPTAMTGVKITDPMFAKAIADISVNDTLFFTSRQLFYLLDKRFSLKSSDTLFYTIPGYLSANILVFLAIFTSGMIPLAGGRLAIFALLVVNSVLIEKTFTASRSSKYLYKQRQTFAKNLQNWGKIVLVCGIGISLLFSSYLLFLVSCGLGILAMYLGSREIKRKLGNSQKFTIDSNQFQDWINTWTAINTITRMLPPPRDLNASAAVSPDVSAYSFDRLVVCDRPEIAQFLIANNFHFENNCAVLSITGYPQSIFDTTMEMLRRNPDLKVYALHDCSPKGLGLVHHLRTSPNWFPDNSAIIIDIGLLPRQIIAGGGSMFVLSSQQNAQDAAQLPAEIRQDLFSDELKWLELGNYVELESFSPQKLIQILNRGIAGSRDVGSDDSSLILLGGTESSIYVVDSFG
ncbi:MULTISPECIES: hypothetical protein [unclassified Microcoleus]|uniref:hypothetical protein n=1 Tax=unclassified Microcoleus TaxID=2642155 RepID=UPI002FD61ACA